MPDEASQQQQPDFMALWREWLTQTERQFNAFFNEMLSSEAVARSMGGYMEVYAMFQRMVADSMERYLAFINMPSRSDVVSLGETLRNIENRLARIEEAFRIAASIGADGELGPEEPARTRRPASMPLIAESTAPGAVPEELRRS